MIGLGVGIDYALFIVTRFRENYLAPVTCERSVVEAMDTSGRAILLAGTTVVIALLGMFATGVELHVWARDRLGARRAADPGGLADAAAGDPLALRRPARAPPRRAPTAVARRAGRRRGRREPRAARPEHARRGGAGARSVQARPWPLAIVSLAVMIALLVPVFALRLDSSDAGNDPAGMSSRHAFDLLAQGFGPGFNGPLLLVAELPGRGQAPRSAGDPRAALAATPDVVAVTQPRLAPSGTVAVIQVYPDSAPQALATTNLVNHLRDHVLPPIEHRTGVTVLVGGFTAGSIDFSNVLASKLPLFIGIVVAALGAVAVRHLPLAGDRDPGGGR